MITASYKQGIDAMSEVLPIREEVFRKEQGLPIDAISDGYDDHAIHVVAYDGKRPVGVGRLVVHDNQYSIDKIAVRRDMRKHYYGDLIVRMLVRKGFDLGADSVHVCAQVQASLFYRKVGFVTIGEPYERYSIAYVDMVMEKDGLKKKCHQS